MCIGNSTSFRGDPCKRGGRGAYTRMTPQRRLDQALSARNRTARRPRQIFDSLRICCPTIDACCWGSAGATDRITSCDAGGVTVVRALTAGSWSSAAAGRDRIPAACFPIIWRQATRCAGRRPANRENGAVMAERCRARGSLCIDSCGTHCRAKCYVHGEDFERRLSAN